MVFRSSSAGVGMFDRKSEEPLCVSEWATNKRFKLRRTSSYPSLTNRLIRPLSQPVPLSLLSRRCKSCHSFSYQMINENILCKEHHFMPGKVSKFNSNLNGVQNVFEELLFTEELFVKEIYAIVQGYMYPLLSQSKEVPPETFGNIIEIYEFNRLFFDELKNCSSVSGVCRIFTKKSFGFFIVYSQYCRNYPKALESIRVISKDPSMLKCLENLQAQLNHKLALASYLLKPVQRISKYVLFLQNILKKCDKNDEDSVKEALDSMTEILRHINCMQNLSEDKKFQFSPNKEIGNIYASNIGDIILQDDVAFLSPCKSKIYLHIFLFSKALLIAKKKNKNKFLVKMILRADRATILEDVNPQKPFEFIIASVNESHFLYRLQAISLDQKILWCHNLKRVFVPFSKSAILISELRLHLVEYEQKYRNCIREHGPFVHQMANEKSCMKFEQIFLDNVYDFNQSGLSPHQDFLKLDSIHIESSDEFSTSSHSKISNNKIYSREERRLNKTNLLSESKIVSPQNSNYFFTLRIPKSKVRLKDKFMLSYKEAKCEDIVLEGCSGIYRKLPEESFATTMAESEFFNLKGKESESVESGLCEMLDFFYEDILIDKLEENPHACEDLSFGDDECFCINDSKSCTKRKLNSS